MPKLSFLSSTSGKIAALFVGFLIVAGGAVAYNQTTGNDLVIKSGGKGYGVSFGPNGIPSVNIGEYGCCLPFCSDTFEIECSPEHGYDGDFDPASCSQLNQCEEGCCQVDCKVEEGFPKAACTDIGGEWNAGSCVVGCCTLDDGSTAQLPEKTCLECSGGVSWSEGECKPGYSAELKANSSISNREALSKLLGGAMVPAADFATALTGESWEGEITFDSTINVHTCKEDVNSTWTGMNNTKVTGCSGVSGCKTKTSSHEISFPFDENGRYNYNKGNFKLDATVDSTNIDYTIDVGTYSLDYTGKVIKGAEECQDRNEGGDFDLWE